MVAYFKIHVNSTIEESIPDRLSSDSLQISAGPAKYIKPGSQTIVKLTVKNHSSVGRMATITPQFNGNRLSVDVPISCIYVAPQGTTAVHAIIRSYAFIGTVDIVFAVN